MSRILVVEDEKHLAGGLRFNLEAEGYQVDIVETGEEALERLLPPPSPFEIVILDVMLPGKNGFAVMSEMRSNAQFIPTLILTARGHSQDVLLGFEAGADDYLTKPFELSILLARIRGLLRRRNWLQAAPSKSKDIFGFGESMDKEVDFNSLELRARGQVIRLTQMEANLLRYLIEHEGKSISRKKMLEDVWGLQEGTDTRPIDNFIVRLRRYIEDNTAHPQHLITVRGVGYRFIASPRATANV